MGTGSQGPNKPGRVPHVRTSVRGPNMNSSNDFTRGLEPFEGLPPDLLLDFVALIQCVRPSSRERRTRALSSSAWQEIRVARIFRPTYAGANMGHPSGFVWSLRPRSHAGSKAPCHEKSAWQMTGAGACVLRPSVFGKQLLRRQLQQPAGGRRVVFNYAYTAIGQHVNSAVWPDANIADTTVQFRKQRLLVHNAAAR